MNADRLLALYEKAAEAPDAVARLRRFVLDLAVRGKLVPQEASDEPASELLKRVGKVRKERIQTGELRKSKAIMAPPRDSQLFDLPANWAWSVADQLWDFENGDRSSNYPSRDQLVSDGIPFVNAGHLVGGRVSLDDMNYIPAAKFESLGGGKLRRGDQVYCLRGSLGKHAVFDLDRDAAIASSLVILRPVISDCVPYLSLYLDSDVAQTLLRRFDNGSAQPNLSSANLRKYEIPLPPLAEQLRIVAKVEELMALLHRLEAARTAREATRDRLTAASLARLTVPDAVRKDFRTHARFALSTLPALTMRPDQIRSLRQTILNLAVRGKLAEQDPTDEPASELLKRITAQKASLVKSGEIRKQKTLPPIDDEEISFRLPSGWAWVRLGDLSQFVTSGSRDWAKFYANEGAIFVRMGNLSKDHYQLRLENIQRVNPPTVGEGIRTRLEGGDILISITGDVGMLGLIPEDFGEAYINQHTAMVRPMPEMKGRYLPELFRSPFAQDQFNAPQRGIKNSFRLTDVTQFVVPLPPLAEQHRIVANVDALMTLCDRLEAALTTADSTRVRMFEALLADAMAAVDHREMEAAE